MFFCYSSQWRRSVVKYGGQGQSGQAIKLFQITPYVNDFLKNQQYRSRFSTACSRLEISFTFHLWWYVTCRVIQQQFWKKNVTFYGVKTYSDSSYIFSGGSRPQSPGSTPLIHLKVSKQRLRRGIRLRLLTRSCTLRYFGRWQKQREYT